MGITERKEKQKTEIRKSILDASIKLFVEEGFESVTIRKIADIIEYSPTTIYLYFKDKNEIFYQLHELGFQKLTTMNASLAAVKNPLTRLHRMGENYINFGLANPEFYDVMFILNAPMQALENMENCDWDYGENALHSLMEIIDECMKKGYIKKGDTQAVATAIWGMVHGMVSLQIRSRLDKLSNGKDTSAMMHQSLKWIISSIDKS